MFFFLKYEMPDWMSSGTCLFVLDITGAALQCPTTRDVISVCVCIYVRPPSLPPSLPLKQIHQMLTLTWGDSCTVVLRGVIQ